MATVSFYCTHCRRLLMFSNVSRNAIVYCPYCQQPSIVPDDLFEADSAVSPVAVDSELDFESEVELEFETDFGSNSIGADVPIASHLTPESERRQTARRRNPEESTTPEMLLASADISDDEFIERLGANAKNESAFHDQAPLPAAPIASTQIEAPPVAASVSKMKKKSAPKKTNIDVSEWSVDVPKSVFWLTGVLTIGVVAVVVASFVRPSVAKNGAPTGAAAVDESFALDGALVCRAKNNEVVGDEGAFVFLFPTKAFDSPLVTSGAVPGRELPSDFENFVADLEARGGYFAVAEFDGRFLIPLKKPGEYNVLLVSRKVYDSPEKVSPEVFGEIAQYLFLPEQRLLYKNRFFWTRRKFTPDSATLEKDFGKTGSAFQYVD